MSFSITVNGGSADETHAPPSPYFETYNDLQPKSWWKESEPYSCEPAINGNSPWVEAGMADLGGSDPLSLIRYYGNGSYVRYGLMGFHGCTRMWKYPNSTTHLDTPADPTYYTLGDIDIFVDIARVPEDAEGWSNDDGNRVDMSMADALQSLNDHVDPDHVALHLTDEQTYRLRKPLDGGLQFLVVHSGRRYAFTTLEVADDRDQYLDLLDVWDPSAPGGSRPFNVEGVLVSRYDQTTGTGAYVRLGPAVYNVENPNAMSDVGWGGDDHSLIVDGDSRDLGGGVVASVSRNPDGSYDVTLAGGTVAEFEPWCQQRVGVFDTGCLLDNPR